MKSQNGLLRMPLLSEQESSQIRTYDPGSCVVFRKTREEWGGLSNMAAGYPLKVNGISIRTTEALYQACRYPHKPNLQRRIIEERSPMTAKMRGKPFRKESRPLWESVDEADRLLENVKIMRWCLRVKLAQNWSPFSQLLLETGDIDIVEHSRRDVFWGAKLAAAGNLVGMNVLGRLLMQLREQVKTVDPERLKQVDPPLLPNFRLYGRPIEKVYPYDETLKEAVPNLNDNESDWQMEFWHRLT